MPAFSLGSVSSFAVTTTGAQTIQASKTFLSPAAAAVPLTVQGIVSQTGNLTEWQTDTGNVRSAVRLGGFYTWGKLQVGELPDDINQQMLFASTNGSLDVFTIRGAASQAGHLTIWKNSAGGILSHIDSAGGFNTAGQRTIIVGSSGRIASIQENHSLGTHGFFGGDPVLGLQATAAARKGLVVRGAASQTGALTEWQNSAGTILANMQPDGRFNDNGHIRAMSLANFVAVQGGQNSAGLLPPRWDGNNFSWAGRILLLGAGRGPGFANTHGHYDLVMPASGTVIPAYGGQTNVTVGAAGIPIPIHSTLYAVIDPYGTYTSSTFALVGYTAAFTVPSNWVMVASNTENNNTGPAKLRTAWGAIMDGWKNVAFVNAWTNYGGEYNPVQYYKDTDGFVHIRGLATGGAFGGTIMFTLPVGYRPSHRVLKGTIASDAIARVDVQANGNVLAMTGSGWVSLDEIIFQAYN